MHSHRAKHWVVVHGMVKGIRKNGSYLVSENESTYIPFGVRQCLGNPGRLPLEMIEVKSGSYWEKVTLSVLRTIMGETRAEIELHSRFSGL